jgi:hypothetical protein
MPGDDGGKEGGKEGGQQEGDAKQGRGKNMTFPELMCCMWAALGNERTGPVERPAWEARDCSHARTIHHAPRQGDHQQDQGDADIVPTRKSGQGVP